MIVRKLMGRERRVDIDTPTLNTEQHLAERKTEPDYRVACPIMSMIRTYIPS